MDQYSEADLSLSPGAPGLESEKADHRLSDDIDVPLTAAAERVLARCVDSLGDGRDLVLTDRLLRAISDTPESAAAQLIDEHGKSGEELLKVLQVLLGRGANAATHANAPRLERVVIRAKREAYRRRHAEVSTLHLLMALLRERSANLVLG